MKRTNHTRSDAAIIDGHVAPEQKEMSELLIPDALIDEEGWFAVIDPVLQGKPSEARAFAQKLYDLRREIEHGGEDGARRVVASLDEGIKLTYRYTDIHRAALRLFYLDLAGETVGDHPQELLEAAIERTINRPGHRQIAIPEDLI
jgi:hypothetical protein